MPIRAGLLALLICLLHLGLAGQAIPIRYAVAPITVDGNGEEWDQEQMITFRPSLPCSACANQLRHQWAYDETSLYLLAQVEDRRITWHEQGTGNPRLYFNDGLEVYLDPLADSDSIMGEDDLQFIFSVNGPHVAFRGGDSWLIKVDSALVPKDTSTRLNIVQYAFTQQGSPNDNRDQDQGYVLEVAWPWANLGVTPAEGLALRLDLCMDDMDTLVADLHAADTLYHLFFSSITGHDDFGFPDYWKEARLVGHATPYQRFTRTFSPWWWAFALGSALLLSPWIIGLWAKNRRLRQIPLRASATEAPVVQAASDSPSQPSLPAWVAKCKQLVVNRLDEDLRPEDLAKEVAVSERQFQRMCKEVLDTTPHAFITLIKLEKASLMLQEGTLTVKEVAYAVGFSDPGYFSKVFRKYYNQSPSEMRGVSPGSGPR